MTRREGTRVHVVVTCTKRKTRSPLKGLRVREVEAPTPEARAEAWIDRLRGATGDVVPARELYAGDHWKVALSIPRSASPGLEVRLWVCSAGYGLLPVDAPIAPYSATFSDTHPDAVDRGFPGTRRSDARRTWWGRLATWDGPAPGVPRSLAGLADSDPDAALLIVAAAPYLRALSGDLGEAAGALRTSRQLSIISAAARHLSGLAGHVIPFDDRMQRLLGGADMSLNVRVTRELLRRGVQPLQPDLSREAEVMGRDLERREVPVRSPRTDEDVRRFIRGELGRDSTARWSPLLRKLRSELGQACEQKRFKRLFEETFAEHAEETPADGSRGD